ncbi:hypothetical protein [Nocardia higoensis]|uniref:hypothetical protein n=1 Tax=Nocardia higoensis TaxID=228599 RepID=UPI0002DF63E3|nr:hypothetical protein [Nocardia higoensis]
MNNPPPPPDPGQGPPEQPAPYRDQPYQPYGEPPAAPKQGGVVAGFAVAGAALFIVVNAVFGFIVFVGVANGGNSYRVILGLAAAFGALAAFGGGTLLILVRKPVAKGLGMGLMIGWALVTICTAGFCTGVNPNLYSAPPSPTLAENGAQP